MNIVVSPHPGTDEDWENVDLGFDNAVVWPRQTERPVAEAAIEDVAGVPVEVRTGISTLLLRRLLALDAGLNAAYSFYRGRRRAKRARRKLELEPRETSG